MQKGWSSPGSPFLCSSVNGSREPPTRRIILTVPRATAPQHSMGLPGYHRQQLTEDLQAPGSHVCVAGPSPQPLNKCCVCMGQVFASGAPFPAPPCTDALLLSPSPSRQPCEAGWDLGRMPHTQLPSSGSTSGPWEVYLDLPCVGQPTLPWPTCHCQIAPANLLPLDFMPESGVSLCSPSSSGHLSVCPASLQISLNQR